MIPAFPGMRVLCSHHGADEAACEAFHTFSFCNMPETCHIFIDGVHPALYYDKATNQVGK